MVFPHIIVIRHPSPGDYRWRNLEVRPVSDIWAEHDACATHPIGLTRFLEDLDGNALVDNGCRHCSWLGIETPVA